MPKTPKIILIIVITLIIAVTCFYLWQNKISIVNQSTNEDYSTITILVPEDYDVYRQNITEFVQTGGEDPLLTTKFVEKDLTIPYTDDPIKASAQTAAEEITPSGGPEKASISYFKIQNNTAYILLDIDSNGYAGASVSQAIIHPLIEKTLLQFSEVDKIVFDYAPTDK